ncbi:hypothetical protein PFICI_04204 [Pestalotiopsis fici W106-1]|uniref:cyclin-dependent kinase n=1 Tax=Pestalotiopsis fici (strain W106-1 / CGMCC3.15140) TaxID=1229662 RepID=W3X880_PESFW|nr:uncharacterized protein PFICI_04204 [Pestalotiopsis fici W106-1]ETS82328.1 hypothetical protein PFICI_04204 [Pestalotiopsis fici W106-1]
MSGETDWRSNLSSLTRYENIQALKASIELADPLHASAQKQAFTIENEAYKNSNTLDEYHAACQYNHQSEPESLATEQHTELIEPAVPISNISIGQYGNCLYVASGVTAEVYRSGSRALKVITETRSIEPHNPAREAKILATLERSCIPLLETFRDQEQRFVLVFPYMPTSLEALIAQGSISLARLKKHFIDIFGALEHIHEQGIIHRDIKPSAVLLASPDGPAYLSDFGTAWHPTFSATAEPKDQKILDIGTGAYRAPEVLFGDKSYGTAVDMWGAGAMLAECSRNPPRTLFESRPVHEDGNQLGLILSIFKTMGSPTRESWPEAANFKTPPFDMYRSFEQHTWEEILPDTRADFRALIARLVHYNSNRATAAQASTRVELLYS